LGGLEIQRPYLTIAIPTYNRAEKVYAALSRIKETLETSENLHLYVQVLVSDNGSTDNTLDLLREFNANRINYRWYTQNSNLGLDGNMLFLYQKCKTEYIWYFSDDDVLFPGAFERVLNTIFMYSPSGLLFSFTQPVGSKVRTFNFNEEVSIIRDPQQMIRLLSQCPKLSIYVYRRIEFDKSEWDYLSQFLGTDFYFIALGYSILQKSALPELAIISEPLAGCGNGFNHIRFSPQTWGNAWIVFKHRYVRAVAPSLEHTKRRESYYDQIQALFAVKVGNLIVPNIREYDLFAKHLKIEWVWLFRNPRSMGQLFFLKLGLTSLWVKLFLSSIK
jgi:glycosyltransferase involved in cell wall biosynthesis